MIILICDDDFISRENTKIQVEHWITERSRKDEIVLFDNGDSLLDYLSKQKADLLLLDIMMPILSGMETAHIIRERALDIKLVFLTSAAEFAIESYEVNASGYLLKPPAFDKLSALMDKLLLSPQDNNDRILVKTHMGFQSLEAEKITCIEAQGKNVIFHMSDGSKIEAIGKFSLYIEQLADNRSFFKCHRSYLIGLSHVKSFTSSEVILNSNMRCPIARGLGNAFKEAYLSHTFCEK